jgi:peptide deformylase
VRRAETVTVRALGRDGQPYEFTCSGLEAVCVQHEMDHLDGKVFVDYLTPLKREMAMKKLAKLAKAEG